MEYGLQLIKRDKEQLIVAGLDRFVLDGRTDRVLIRSSNRAKVPRVRPIVPLFLPGAFEARIEPLVAGESLTSDTGVAVKCFTGDRWDYRTHQTTLGDIAASTAERNLLPVLQRDVSQFFKDGRFKPEVSYRFYGVLPRDLSNPRIHNAPSKDALFAYWNL